jgi:hypothetical protein
MIIFQSDETSIIICTNIKTHQIEVQWNFYRDYMVLSPENFRAMITEIYNKIKEGLQP